MDPPLYENLIMPELNSEKPRLVVLVVGDPDVLEKIIWGFIPEGKSLEESRLYQSTYEKYQICLIDTGRVIVEAIMTSVPDCRLSIPQNLLQQVQLILNFMTIIRPSTSEGFINCVTKEVFQNDIPKKNILVEYKGGYKQNPNVRILTIQARNPNLTKALPRTFSIPSSSSSVLNLSVEELDNNNRVTDSQLVEFYLNPEESDGINKLRDWIIPIILNLVLSSQEQEALELVRKMISEGRVIFK